MKVKTYPGRDEKVVVPPQTAAAQILAIDPQGQEAKGKTREKPEDQVQLRA